MHQVSLELCDALGWSQDVLADLVVHFANSLSVQHMATLGIGIPCGVILSSSSCIPLSQCKPQALWRRERLRVIVFDKIAILSSERASKCTKILYFKGVSKCSCLARSLLVISRIGFPPSHPDYPSDSQQ